MGILTKLFGYEGKVHFTCTDSNGDTLKGKVHIETIGMSKDQIEKKLTEHFYYDKGLRVSNMKLVYAE